eukprot:7275524-Prymnesium_polylepis.1
MSAPYSCVERQDSPPVSIPKVSATGSLYSGGLEETAEASSIASCSCEVFRSAARAVASSCGASCWGSGTAMLVRSESSSCSRGVARELVDGNG